MPSPLPRPKELSTQHHSPDVSPQGRESPQPRHKMMLVSSLISGSRSPTRLYPGGGKHTQPHTSSSPRDRSPNLPHTSQGNRIKIVNPKLDRLEPILQQRSPKPARPSLADALKTTSNGKGGATGGWFDSSVINKNMPIVEKPQSVFSQRHNSVPENHNGNVLMKTFQRSRQSNMISTGEGLVVNTRSTNFRDRVRNSTGIEDYQSTTSADWKSQSLSIRDYKNQRNNRQYASSSK